MIQMSTQELCKAVDGELVAGLDGEFIGVSIDSRTIESGQLFFAIIGEQMDGHTFVERALANGGVGAIVEREQDISLQTGQFLIKVANTTQALQNLAHYYRRKFDLKVVGVTGSVGKTTTKDMIAAVLSSKYSVLKTEGNLNNYYGLPLTLFRITPQHQVLVVEMGMSALKEIELLAKLAEPQYGVVTNVSYSHMEYLKTLENVAKAKQELIENLVGERIAVLNVDDQRVKEMAALVEHVVFFGLTAGDYRLIRIQEDTDLVGLHLVVDIKGQKRAFHIPISGEHNALNALAAIAIGRILGLDDREIQLGLDTFTPSKMRMNILKTSRGITVLNDAYNANPTSMKAALQVLAKYTDRKIAILGDMLELGEFAGSAHYELGSLVAQNRIDLLLIKGDYREVVARGAKDSGFKVENIFTYSTNREISEHLITIAQPGDIVLVKGSRGMVMEEIVNDLLEEV